MHVIGYYYLKYCYCESLFFFTSNIMENLKTSDKHNIFESTTCPTCKVPYNATEVIEIMPNFDEENEEEMSSISDTHTLDDNMYSEVDELTNGNYYNSLDNLDVQSISGASNCSSSLNAFNHYVHSSVLDEGLFSSLPEDEFDTDKSDVESIRTCDLRSPTLSTTELSFPNNNCIVKQNCAVKLCNENARNHFDDLFFIGFPNQTELRDYWWRKCGHADEFDPSSKICSIHFDPNEFTSVNVILNSRLYQKTVLKNRDTVPSLYLLPQEYTKFTRKQEKNISGGINSGVEKESSETTVCAIKSCKNTFSKDGRTKLFFKFPLKNELLLKKWLGKIRLSNWQPLDTDRICSDHFENYYITYSSNVYQLDKYATPSLKPKNPFVTESINIYNHSKRNENCNTGHDVDKQFENLELISIDNDMLLVKKRNNKEKKKIILLNSLENVENNTGKDEQQISHKEKHVKYENCNLRHDVDKKFENLEFNSLGDHTLLVNPNKRYNTEKEKIILLNSLENNTGKDEQQIHREKLEAALILSNLSSTNFNNGNILLIDENKRKNAKDGILLDLLENNVGKDEQKLLKEKLETALTLLHLTETNFNKSNISLINEKKRKNTEEEDSTLLDLLENNVGIDGQQISCKEVSETATTHSNLTKTNFSEGDVLLPNKKKRKNIEKEESSFSDWLENNTGKEVQQKLQEKLETARTRLHLNETNLNKGNVLLINEKNKKSAEEEDRQEKQQKLHTEISEAATTLSNLTDGSFNKGENVLNSSTKGNNSSLEYMDILDDMNNIELQLQLENSNSITRQYLESFTREIAEELINGNSNTNNVDLDNIDLDSFNCGSMEEVQPINNTNDGFPDTLTIKNNDLKTKKCDVSNVSPIECGLYSNRDNALKVNLPKQVNDVPTTDFVKESLKLLNSDYDSYVPESDPEVSLENVLSEEFDNALSFIESMPKVVSSYSSASEMKTQFFMTSVCLEIMYKIYTEKYIFKKARPPLTKGQFSKIYNQSMKTIRFVLNEQSCEKYV